jgi:hypothetical protein
MAVTAARGSSLAATFPSPWPLPAQRARNQWRVHDHHRDQPGDRRAGARGRPHDAGRGPCGGGHRPRGLCLLAPRRHGEARRLPAARRRHPARPSGPVRPPDGGGDGQARHAGAERGGEVRLGVRVLRGPRSRIPRIRGNFDRRLPELRQLSAARSDPGCDALELPLLAGLPLRRAQPDGRQRRRPQACLQRPRLRPGHCGGDRGGRLPGGAVPDRLPGQWRGGRPAGAPPSARSDPHRQRGGGKGRGWKGGAPS